MKVRPVPIHVLPAVIIRQVIPNQEHQQPRRITALLQPTVETRIKVPLPIIQEPAGQAIPIQDRLLQEVVLLPQAQVRQLADPRQVQDLLIADHPAAVQPIVVLHAHQEAAQLIALHHAHHPAVQVTAAGQAARGLPEAATVVDPAVPDHPLHHQEAAVLDLPGHLPHRRAEDN